MSLVSQSLILGSVGRRSNFSTLKAAFRVVAAVAILSEACATLHAEESTSAQRQACKPDAYHLCKWYIPSHGGITYCLRKNIDHLSPDCRSVMEDRLR
jgi:hypothetical protein